MDIDEKGAIMGNTTIRDLEDRIKHLEDTLEKLFNACYYTKDALNKSGEVWDFFRCRRR